MKIKPLTPSELLLKDSREYSIYICSTRAIPHAGDGLKHGQRIALWLLRKNSNKIKTFALAGLMGFERLYVHGETSANNAISLLAAPFRNNLPLIEGLGAFGSRIAPIDGIGAPRYTDVRRSEAAVHYLYADLDIVPLTDNYDGSNKEPVHFLPLIPTVLLNGISGMGSGWSTAILPRSFKSLVQASQDALMGKKMKGLEPHYERYNLKVEATGKENQWLLTGKAEITDTSTVRITELPYDMKIEDFRDRLILMHDQDLITGYEDRSTDCINISVRFKRGSIKGWTEEDAIRFFKLTERTTERIVVLDWGGEAIRQYSSPEELITDFVQWRLGWYSKRYEKMRDDDAYELIYWKLMEALIKDNFTKKLGTFTNKRAMEDDVREVASRKKVKGLDDTHVSRAVGLATYRWTKEFEAEVAKEIERLTANVKEYEAILADPERRKKIYYDELEALKKLKI